MSVGAGNCSQGSGAAWPSVTPDRDPRQELWREGLALLGPFRDTLGMRPLKEKAPRRQEAAGGGRAAPPNPDCLPRTQS